MSTLTTTRTLPRLRIALVAPARYPIREPFAGGLEAFCQTLVQALRGQGHHVDFYAARGSEGHVRSMELPGVDWRGREDEATDTGYPPGGREIEDLAFARLFHHLSAGNYDIVHNNSLHPGLFHPTQPLPLLTTLHTPALPDMQQAITEAGEAAGRFVAVSHATAEDWVLPGPVELVPNGVDCGRWRMGPGGVNAVWFGRIVPEKGLHLAMDACRMAGIPLVIAGRAGDRRYFNTEIVPRLTASRATWAGELTHAQLANLVGRSRVCVVSPEWEEPFGLVAVEAMACGTPVAAFRRGGLGEMLADSPAVLAEQGDVAGLARAVVQAAGTDRSLAREWAVENHGLSQFVHRYIDLYSQVLTR